MYKVIIRAIALSAMALASQSLLAAVPAEEAKRLGNELTQFGAEAAGNADKTIPAYTGPVAPPSSYQKGSGMRPDPFAADKPLYAITAANMAQYEARLTAASRELLKRYPTMRMDVYPTRRSVGFPKWVLDNTVKNATSAKTVDDGETIEEAYSGIPFPIPKTGQEAMWNHRLRYQGPISLSKYDTWNVDSAGKAVLSASAELYVESPFYDSKRTAIVPETENALRIKLSFTGPAFRVGEALLVLDYMNPLKNPRKAWQYLPGQRRVKLAPNIAYDAPDPGTQGMTTFDDGFVFNGAMDRYDWKLVGKREMIVPYNGYRMAYAPDAAAVTTPNHVNPDFMRWELHRVWVVEATLKEGKRHVYSKRVFYIDEDSWLALASDEYDARNALFRGNFGVPIAIYELPAPSLATGVVYNFIGGGYSVSSLYGKHGVGIKYVDPLPPSQWTADSLAGAGVR
jgi:hypothetical protein